MRKLTDRFFQQKDGSIIDSNRKIIMRPIEDKYYNITNNPPIKCNIKRIVSNDRPIRIEIVLLRVDDDKLCLTNFFSFFIHPHIPNMDLFVGGRYIADVVKDESMPSKIKIKKIKRII